MRKHSELMREAHDVFPGSTVVVDNLFRAYAAGDLVAIRMPSGLILKVKVVGDNEIQLPPGVEFVGPSVRESWVTKAIAAIKAM